MFTRNFRVVQPCFINILNYKSSLIRTRMQKFIFPLQPGNVIIKNNDRRFNMSFNYLNNKTHTTNYYELEKGDIRIVIPDLDYNCVLNFENGGNMYINWDKNDEVKDIVVINNEEFYNLVPCLINEVPYLK